ncbi:DUF362 domain-containing protein [Candidatus Dojkabacteria bacterium]|nr:DUF362 domain-containing protein [Candidatus Dojkabacteria bacterium]
MKKVTKIKVSGDLKESVRRVVEILGGFGSYIGEGETVFLKPNFNTADPFPASSDPEFLRCVIELVFEQKPREVILGDSCTFSQNTRKVMETLKIFDFKKMQPAPKIMALNEHKWVRKEIPNGKFLKCVSVPEILDRVDKLIFLPCLKTHAYAQYTGALKLSVGLMKTNERFWLHFRKLQEKIGELNRVISPDLIIMDARKCFINRGPSEGEMKEPNLIMASRDRVSIDIEGVKIIQGYEGNSLKGIKAEELPQIKYAEDSANK